MRPATSALENYVKLLTSIHDVAPRGEGCRLHTAWPIIALGAQPLLGECWVARALLPAGARIGFEVGQGRAVRAPSRGSDPALDLLLYLRLPIEGHAHPKLAQLRFVQLRAKAFPDLITQPFVPHSGTRVAVIPIVAQG